MLLAGEGAQIDRWLRPAVRGVRVCSIAITEPGAGSDAAAITTHATEDGAGGWVLNGGKPFISDGLVSDFFVVSAVTDPGKGARGISFLLVDRGTPGLTIGRDQPMMGLRGTSHVELSFDNLMLGAEHLLGARGEGFRMALGMPGRVRLAQAGARAVGKATKVLDLTLGYACARRQSFPFVHPRTRSRKSSGAFCSPSGRPTPCAADRDRAGWLFAKARPKALQTAFAPHPPGRKMETDATPKAGRPLMAWGVPPLRGGAGQAGRGRPAPAP